MYRGSTQTGIVAIITCLLLASPALANQHLVSVFTTKAPTVDGKSAEAAWSRAAPITVKDGAAEIDITLRSVHTDTSIYFLVIFPDADESRSHRPWIWNDQSGFYEVGPEREDCFVFKWFMETAPADIHIDSDQPHTADTWFWKADRTDPVGYADDKIQRLVHHKLKKAIALSTRSGKTVYLQRTGDQGQAAYIDQVFADYQGPVLRRFENQAPSGSRADIRAKGRWKNGLWTVEFSRRLDTGHYDDIKFDAGRVYLFGVARYEVAGRKPDHNTTQPLYGAGRLSERLFLRFSR